MNAFMPAWSIPYLAWSATIAESTLGLALLIGYELVWVSRASAALLFLFGAAMWLSFGAKSPLDDSVFSAAGASLLIAAFARRSRAMGRRAALRLGERGARARRRSVRCSMTRELGANDVANGSC